MTAAIGLLATAWWQALQPVDIVGKTRRGDRAALARLRRCATVNDAVFDEATHKLCHHLDAGERGLERAALVAAVLAQVRVNNSALKVARQIGVPTTEGAATMSELRFRRLLQADSADEQLTGFRRLVALAGRELNVADLAQGLWRWDDADRRRWVYAYYDAPRFSTPSQTPFAQEQAP